MRQSKYLVLIAVQDRLISQAHLRNNVAAYAIEDVGGFFLFGQNFSEIFVGDFDLIGLWVKASSIEVITRGKRPVSLPVQNRVARVPSAVSLKRMENGLLHNLALDSTARSGNLKLLADRK